jgi:SSS family solute:Na+ symporter/sodium/pantothenate symporter
LIPDLDKTDEIVPRLALALTKTVPGGPFVAGLILAAPFGAVMATVSAYLLVIASGLVKDLYLRFVNPHASPERTRHVTYTAMILVGVAAVALNVRPVQYLQALVVMSGTTGAATFVVPTLMACYWRRATAIGTISSMLAGAGTMIFLYVAGWIDLFGPDEGISIPSTIAPAYLGGVDPLLWGLAASLITGVVASLLTPHPDAKLVSWLFDKQAA